MSNRRRRREVALETLAVLAERFPQAFVLKGPRRPLKIGIDRDLAVAAADLSRNVIMRAMRYYVSSSSYQLALAQSRERVDLTGAPAGVVSIEATISAKVGDDPARAIPNHGARAERGLEIAAQKQTVSATAGGEQGRRPRIDGSNGATPSISRAPVPSIDNKLSHRAANIVPPAAAAPHDAHRTTQASGRPKLTLASLREAARQRKTADRTG